VIKLIWRLFGQIGSRSVSLTASAGLLAQLGRPLISLVTLPMLLQHLGQAGLGVWMIALSLMGLIATVNAGLSISLVTLIGRADSQDSGLVINRLSTAASLIAALTSILVLSIFVPIGLVIDWTDLLDLSGDPSGEQMRWMMIILTVLLAFSIIVSVPRQIMLGRMHGYLAHLLDFAGLMIGAIALIVGILSDAPLWLLALAFMGPSPVIVFAGGLLYLRSAGIRLFSPRHLDRRTFDILRSDSIKMVVYQSAYSISSQSDIFLIGMILGAPASAAYGIAQRVFSLPVMIAATVNNAQWPSIARADAAGDHANTLVVFRRTLVICSTGATGAAMILAFAYQPLIYFWLGDQIDTDPALILGMVCWVGVATLVTACDMVLRARSETRLLMSAMTVMAVINLTATLALLPVIGAAGAIWGSIIGYMLALLIPYSVRLYNVFEK
jgi:O-antigen/teichoic acid export membrane protein